MQSKHIKCENMKVSYDDLDQQNSCSINEMQRYFFAKCVHLAHKSNLTQKHGCVLVKNNKIISCGYNFKLKKFEQNPYTMAQPQSHSPDYNVYSVHAEISTIKKVKKQDLSNCELYVIRIGPLASKRTELKETKEEEHGRASFEFKYSCPCPTCAKTIKLHGIRRVYYSVNS